MMSKAWFCLMGILVVLFCDHVKCDSSDSSDSSGSNEHRNHKYNHNIHYNNPAYPYPYPGYVGYPYGNYLYGQQMMPYGPGVYPGAPQAYPYPNTNVVVSGPPVAVPTQPQPYPSYNAQGNGIGSTQPTAASYQMPPYQQPSTPGYNHHSSLPASSVINHSLKVNKEYKEDGHHTT